MGEFILGIFCFRKRRNSKKMRIKGTGTQFWVSLMIENDVIMVGKRGNMCLIL